MGRPQAPLESQEPSQGAAGMEGADVGQDAAQSPATDRSARERLHVLTRERGRGCSTLGTLCKRPMGGYGRSAQLSPQCRASAPHPRPGVRGRGMDSVTPISCRPGTGVTEQPGPWASGYWEDTRIRGGWKARTGGLGDGVSSGQPPPPVLPVLQAIMNDIFMEDFLEEATFEGGK